MRPDNLSTSLRRRNRPGPMERYDRLPSELRRWLAGAALPWSPQSALKLWTRLRRECGADIPAIRRRLDQAERRMLARDAGKVWGADHPAAQPVEGDTGSGARNGSGGSGRRPQAPRI